MLNVYWVKSTEGAWLSLERVTLTNVDTDGVYVIWHTGNPGRVVRIGQGDIKSRLLAHRRDSEILDYKRYGELRVTWAAVRVAQLDGVERYLADRYPPLVGDAFPDVRPIAVNDPWS